MTKTTTRCLLACLWLLAGCASDTSGAGADEMTPADGMMPGDDDTTPGDGEPAAPPEITEEQLANRAYVVSLESDELTVIDLDRLEIIGQISTRGMANHMVELNRDFTKVYIDSSETHETIVVDARSLSILHRIQVGAHPTHMSLAPDGKLMFVMEEEDDAVGILDTERDEIVKEIHGLFTPHFARFSPDGRHAYVANINAYHLTRIDLETLEIDGHIPLEGYAGPPAMTEAPNEGGFADAQIDQDGVLYAAHNATGRVLVYDTVLGEKREELQVGAQPWMVYAEHPFAGISPRYVVPNFGDESASVIDGVQNEVIATLKVADRESFGVNYSPEAPGQAFLMNRFKQEIAVIDTDGMQLVDRIDVGGTTETASTTADGRYIVAAVSSANSVVVIEAATHKVIKRFEKVGKYPWSVTIANGQNYCH